MKAEQIYANFENFRRNMSREENPSMKKGGLQRICENIEVGLEIVGARPCMGSSSFVVSMAMEMAKAGKRILFYAHPFHKIDEKVFRYAGVKEGCSCPFLKDLSFYYSPIHDMDDFTVIKEHMWQDVIDLRPDYVFIDSLSDIVVDDRVISNRLKPEEYMCRELREQSIQMDIPIIVVAGLNRNTERRAGVAGKVPQRGDFRGGDLAYYASKIYFPYRLEYYGIYNDACTGEDFRGCMYIYGCGLGDCEGIKLKFDPQTARVYDPEQENWVSEDDSTPSDLPF